MNIKIVDIDVVHNNEYAINGVKEIIAVRFYDTKHIRKASLICRMG